MSVLSQNILDVVDNCVVCRSFMEEYRAWKWNLKQGTGVIGNSPHPYPKFDKPNEPVRFLPDTWSINDGIHSTQPIVMAGIFDFDKYKIPRISSAWHISVFPSNCEMKNFPPLHTPNRLLIHGHLASVNNVDLTANTIEFNAQWVGRAQSISDSKIQCETLKFAWGYPKLHNCTGNVQLLEIKWFDAADIDEKFRSWIVPGIYTTKNRKKVSKWKDLKAIVNLTTKYGRPDATYLGRFLDLSHLEEDLGVIDMNLRYLRFKNCDVDFNFAKIDGHWELVNAIKH